jgi:hypothetical protein
MDEVLRLLYFSQNLLASISFLHTRALAFPLMVFSRKLVLIAVNAREISALLHGSEFQQISGRNSERLLSKLFLADQGFTSINHKALVRIY